MTAIEAVGYDHHWRKIEPDDMEKLGKAIQAAVKEVMGGKVDDDTEKAWQKLVDIITQEFNEGLAKCGKEHGYDDDKTQSKILQSLWFHAVFSQLLGPKSFKF